MLRTTLAAVSLALAAGPSPSTAAPAVNASSRIDAVTVYRSTARVLRIARVELPAGPSRVLLAGLPDGLDDDSIRVDGQGAARARVFGVTVERVTGEAAQAAEARAAEARVESLQDEDRALQDRIQAAQARAKFVESLRSTYSEERAKNLAVRGVTVKEWSDLSTFVESALSDSAAQVRKSEAARRELGRRLAQARADLEKVQSKRGKTLKTVAVELESEKGGPLDLEVSYAVASAGWQPIWDARLVPDTSTMELSFLGSVWNRSGEDWAGVALSVSTAQPQRGLAVPQVETRWLDRPQPVQVGFAVGRGAMAPAAKAAAAPPPAAPAEADVALNDAKVERAQTVVATADEGLLSATFKAPRRESIDGSGQARKVALASFPLKAQLVRIAAPRNEAAAYLVAKAVNETGFPLLPGMAGVYVGDEFVGRAPLPATPPGGEIEMAFGADDRVEVARKVLERKRESAGVVSKDEVMRYRVRISLKNRYASPVSVRLLDLVPVSHDEKIRVEVLDGTTKPTREDPERPGVRIWEIQLAGKEEKVVEIRYEVRWPQGTAVAGLE